MTQTPTAVDQAEAKPEADAVPRGYWKNAAGALVPITKIKPIDKARDALVRDIAGRALAMNGALASFKTQVMAEIDAFVAQSAAEYGVTVRGSVGKGNITLTSFDGSLKVERQVSERIAFDERLQIAKAKIDKLVHKWGKGANHNLQALVNHAFRVDKAGQVSVGAVLSLRQVQVDDPDWALAMTAIADSMQAVSSVQYVRMYQRNEAGGYDPISLNAASV